MKYKKVIKVAGFMAIITVISKFLGLIREMMLASIYGAGPELTAFLAGSKVPLTLFDVTLGGVVSAAFIPVFSETVIKKDKKAAFKFTNEYINFILMITIVLTVVGLIFTRQLIMFTLSGGDIAPETIQLAVNLSKIMFPMIIFTGVTYCFVGLLNCHEQFYITSVLSFVSNSVIILYLLINGSDIYGLAIVMLMAWSLQVIVQLPFVYKYGFRYRPIFHFSPEMKTALLLAVPILVSSWAAPISSLINMKMASGLYEGKAIVALELASRLYVVVSGIFAYVISNLSYPFLSKAGIDDDKHAIGNLLDNILKSITLIITPIMIGIIFFATPLVRLAYERGNFTPEDTQMTALALMSLGTGMLSFSYNEVLNKTFYALKQPKIPMYTAMVGIVVSIILSLILPRYLSIVGLGLATSFGTIATNLLNFISIKKLVPINRKKWVDFIKMAVKIIIER
ncbi:murein biosynthesis integral membrane protein MurJ [Candidatus Epulonipiscium fishelsonii]|uniref:Murein biosynthesis integral membrane protein MurJ n=1 Tax=Candidatus Epulonipiscium fishelsonii TaxID=77094 RepID=A0ACC8X940_9FIRM|nr:murein biosynthesis integral membrane protein MurJ [Epulopiscium sp. SCG-B11WGA-EpuloA1]ONI43160.1 murein biosynthesis integral membrane protein MurJ [Epulopiscium sp. SCG-B05WGA-EpuloA1]